jgi:glycosyltransferase involved in cell wall biosynthesis
MNVLVISQHYWPETFRINEVTHSLRESGCNVRVLTGQPNYPDGIVFPGYSAGGIGTEVHDGYVIHRVPLIPRGNSSGLRLILNYLSFIVSASVIGPWLLRKQPIDVILVFASSPILQVLPAICLKFLKRAVLITWVQDLWPESLEATGFLKNKRLLQAIGVVVRWIYRRNDRLLVQSRAFIEPTRAMAGATPVVYHPNPGELAFGRTRPDETPALRLNPGFNVVFAGNLGTVQSLDTVLAAAEKLQHIGDLHWVLIGSGSRSDWLKAEVGLRGLARVQLPGRFEPEAMPGILAQASVLLVSLVRSPIMTQTVPSKVQAYLAAGRPVIAALDGEGARVVEEAGAGIGCPAEDAQALAEAVVRLKGLSTAELERMGAAGRRYYELHFDPDMLARQLVQQFQETLAMRLQPIKTN